MNRLFMAALVIAVLSAPSPAQVSDGEPQERDGDRVRSREGRRDRGKVRRERGEAGRRDRGEGWRDRGEEGRRDRGEGRRERRRGPRFGRMFDYIAEKLELDDEQMQQFEEIKAGHRERMEQFRQRREAVRQAREEGNDELAEQLRSEFRAEREEAGGPREWMRQAIESLDPILTEDQRERLAEMRERYQQRREGRRQGRERRSQQMFEDIAENLELNEEQAQQFEEIRAGHRERMEQFRQRREAVRQAREEGNDELAEQLRSELWAEREETGGPREWTQQAMESLDPILTEDQRGRLAEMREGYRKSRRGRGAQERRGGGEGRWGDRRRRMADDLPDQLGLDEQQRKQYTALVEAQGRKMRENQEKIQPLRDQLREARDSNDSKRFEALQAQIEALRSGGKTGEDAFFGQVEGILRADQVERFAEYRADAQFERGLDEIPADMRTLLRTARRLRLDKEQKAELKKVYNYAKKSWPKARRADKKNRSREKEAEAALTAEVRRRILEVLNEQQVEKFNEQLKRLDRKGGKRNRERTRNI